MADREQDEFFVGYVPRAPRGIAARTRLAVVAIVVLAAALAVLLVGSQRPFSTGVFEFGVGTELVGIVAERPYPTLWVVRPGRAGAAPPLSSYHLVAFGKHGAADLVAGLDGRPVRLEGSLVYRDDRTMVEIADGTLEPLEGAAAEAFRELRVPLPEPLGERTLVGEIVDSKCFLGVMKPGHLKPHRSCAVRCISGGIPPTLVVRDADGVATYFVLVSSEGEPVNDEVLDLVAEPVRVTGVVVRYGGLLMLRADPATFTRL